MTLRRTASSFGSLHLFYGADVVVFCEGGKSKTKDEALLRSLDGRTLDNIFWAAVAAICNNGKRYHFKSVGSKTVLLSIARDIEGTNLKNITICIDSDYDYALGISPSRRRVARTMGYSWESDVLSEKSIQNIFQHLVGPYTDDALNELIISINGLRRRLCYWTEIDISLKSKGKVCVFDRDNANRCIDRTCNPHSINEIFLRQKLTQIGYVRRPRRVVDVTEIDVLRVSFGRLVSKLIYHKTLHFAKKVIPTISINYDHFMRVAIRETFYLVQGGELDDVQQHFREQCTHFS